MTQAVPRPDARQPSPEPVYRGRLAPSPTGTLHLGHARTSLVAWLRARQAGGRLALRIEDLDGPRVRPGSEAGILRDLAWLGLDWDEGPDVGGPHGPYRQSERLDRYGAALERLRDAGHVYPCTCSRKEVASIASAPHGFEELGVAYPGTCRGGPTHPDRPPAWRFRMPAPAPPFVDAVRGAVAVPEAASDFVVRRADGVFAYQLAVVVDDEAMGVTEVVRGDDLLSSTPRQVALREALLGMAAGDRGPTAWLHVPLVLDAAGERLSKRHGSAGLAALREAGHPPERVVGRLAATLGLGDGSPVSARALVGRLDVAAIPRTPVRLPS